MVEDICFILLSIKAGYLFLLENFFPFMDGRSIQFKHSLNLEVYTRNKRNRAILVKGVLYQLTESKII
jgi:hypothetical protein